MSLRLEFHPAVGAELAHSHDWYERRQPGLGGEFLDELHRVLEQIAANPACYGFVQDGIRVGLLTRFPFAVFYRLLPDRIRVLAIFHTARDSSGWQSRTSPLGPLRRPGNRRVGNHGLRRDFALAVTRLTSAAIIRRQPMSQQWTCPPPVGRSKKTHLASPPGVNMCLSSPPSRSTGAVARWGKIANAGTATGTEPAGRHALH